MTAVTQADLDAWINDPSGKGLDKIVPSGQVSVPNPKWDPLDPENYAQPKTIKVDKITVYRNDGTFKVLVGNPNWYPGSDEPEYDQTGTDVTPKVTGTQDPNTQRSNAVKAEQDETALVEKRRNLSGQADPAWLAAHPDFVPSGYFETDLERKERLDKVAATGRTLQKESDAAAVAAKNREEDVAYRNEQLGLSKNADARAAETAARSARNEERSIEQQRAQTELNLRRFNELDVPTFQLSQEKFNQEKSNRAEDVAFRGEEFNYRKAQDAAKALRDDYAIKIQLHQMDAQDAANRYNRWYQQNVSLPMQIQQEQRLAAESNLRFQQAQEQQNQFAANFSAERARIGLTAGQNAAQNEIALLPYRVGPTFAPEMANAINAVAKSTTEGVNFSPGSFTFKAPDFEKISSRAAGKATKGLKYSPRTITEPVVPQFQMPDFSTAPQMAGPIGPPEWWTPNGPTPTTPMTAPSNGGGEESGETNPDDENTEGE